MNIDSSNNEFNGANPIRPASSCERIIAEIGDHYEVLHQQGDQPDLDEHLQFLPSHCQSRRMELLNLLLLTDAFYWQGRMLREVTKHDLVKNPPAEQVAFMISPGRA